MGLLDNPNMAMAMSLLANSGYSRVPRTFGQNMGEAFGARMQAEEAMRKRQMEQQQFEMQQKKAQYEMQDIEGRRAMGDKLGGLLGSGQPVDRAKLAGMMAPYDPASALKLLEREREPERPSNLREWDEFQRMTPEQQNRFLEMKRAAQVMNLGGSMAVRAPGGGIREQYPVTPKPEQMPAFQGAQEAAKLTARTGAERVAEAPKAAGRVAAADAKFKNLENIIKSAKGKVGMLSAGPIGQLTSGIGGTPAANLDADLDSIKANLGFDELQEMRDNSPTGGALGQVAVQEIQYLQSVYANLAQKQSPSQLRQNLDNILQAKRESNKRIQAAYQKTYGGTPQAVGEFVGNPEQIRREINQIKDPTQRALALKALETQIGKEKQPKPTGGWSIQKVE